MVGMFVFLCLASQKPSKREFFVPAGTDSGVKLLTHLVVIWHMMNPNGHPQHMNIAQDLLLWGGDVGTIPC